LKIVHGLERGKAPLLDLEAERRLHEMCLEAIDGGLLKSAHDVSEGGLAVCLAECAFHSEKKLGCSVRLRDRIRPDALLFGETQGRIVVTASPARAKKVVALAKKRGVPVAVIGRTGGSDIVVEAGRRERLRIPVLKAFEAWKKAVPAHYAVKA